MNYHPNAPPSLPTGPRSPPVATPRTGQPQSTAQSPPASYAVDRRNSSFDDGDAPMDETMIMRSIWLKLGLLDTINYKMDATLKKLSTLENRMDRLETTVREASGTRRTSVSAGAVNGSAGLDVMENDTTDSDQPMDKYPPPMKLPKPAKRQENIKPMIPSRPAPSLAPTPFAQAKPTPFAQANPTPFAQVNQVNPMPIPSHQPPSQPAAITIDNVIPRSCMLNITNKEECERKLRIHQHNGMYLIRKSDKNPSARVLMVWFQENDICKHYKIFGDQTSQFQLDETPNFTSLVDMLQYYRDHMLPQSNVYLTTPFPG